MRDDIIRLCRSKAQECDFEKFEREEIDGRGLISEQFHLAELYQTHTDYAAEIYYLGKLKLHPKYLHSVKKKLKKLQIGMTKDEKERLFLGFYSRDKDFGNRPLFKFRYDLAVDEGVI